MPSSWGRVFNLNTYEGPTDRPIYGVISMPPSGISPDGGITLSLPPSLNRYPFSHSTE